MRVNIEIVMTAIIEIRVGRMDESVSLIVKEIRCSFDSCQLFFCISIIVKLTFG